MICDHDRKLKFFGIHGYPVWIAAEEHQVDEIFWCIDCGALGTLCGHDEREIVWRDWSPIPTPDGEGRFHGYRGLEHGQSCEVVCTDGTVCGEHVSATCHDLDESRYQHVRVPSQRGDRAGTVTWTEFADAAQVYGVKHGRDAMDALDQSVGLNYGDMTELLGHEPTTWRAS